LDTAVAGDPFEDSIIGVIILGDSWRSTRLAEHLPEKLLIARYAIPNPCQRSPTLGEKKKPDAANIMSGLNST
jgi:hypothetical protein